MNDKEKLEMFGKINSMLESSMDAMLAEGHSKSDIEIAHGIMSLTVGYYIRILPTLIDIKVLLAHRMMVNILTLLLDEKNKARDARVEELKKILKDLTDFAGE